MKHILVVDDNKTNLKIARQVLSKYYTVAIVASGAQAIKYVEQNKPDLILLDLLMPEMDGKETLQHINKIDGCARIPVIFLTGDTNPRTEVECLQLGASDFITKPFVAEIMLSRVSKAIEFDEYQNNLEELVDSKTREIVKLQEKVIINFANLIESRDRYTGKHVKRTSAFVQAITTEMLNKGIYPDIIDEEYLETICKAAPLHDVGKISISDNVLDKPGKLTDEEFSIMKTHTTIGAKIIDEILGEIETPLYLENTREVVLCHHEKWNGTGYPNGLKEEKIPLSARIMAVADVFDALISERPYKKPMSFDKAFGIIEESKGSHFEPCIVDVFLSIRPKIEEISITLRDN